MRIGSSEEFAGLGHWSCLNIFFGWLARRLGFSCARYGPKYKQG